jgi:uncharacterized repeat protein (TIGR04076 family)
MPFKVKATLIAFLGDEKKYPCQFGYEIGDEIIFDGETFVGRICPDILSLLAPKMYALRYAGPRYRDPLYYAPFWYAGVAQRDPTMKKYDGLGLKPVKETFVEPPYHMANLQDPNAFRYPPPKERIVLKDVTVICPDTRAAALFKIEAFDLSDKGHDIPYFRRQMVLLDRIFHNTGIEVEKILSLFTTSEKEDIYPPLNQITMEALIEELESLGYLEMKDLRVYVTEKGKQKLDDFKQSLSEEEKNVLFRSN